MAYHSSVVDYGHGMEILDEVDSRDRERRRDRHRRRDDRSRSPDRRSRGRSRDKDRDHSRYDRRRGYDYHRSSTRDDDGSDEDSRGSRDHERWSRRRRSPDRNNLDRWKEDSPTHTIILKNLPSTVEENDIRGHLMVSNVAVKDVRLVKDKVSGHSRGFAFVEFDSVAQAQAWMEQNQGFLLLLDRFTVNMFYSVPKDSTGRAIPQAPERSRETNTSSTSSSSSNSNVLGDWICSKCGVHNFKRRDHCFKCHIPREESDRCKDGDGYDQVGHNPCNTLVLRGLDALTNEESILTAIARISALGVKNLRVMRSESTGASLGFAFLEMNAIAEASQFLEAINRLNIPFDVDGKAVIVNFSKNTFSTVMATVKQQAANSVAEVWNQYYSQQVSSSGLQGDVTNAAAAVAQAALNSTKQAKTSAAAVASSVISSDASSYPQYPVPDTSTFQYDESSGYYYDPTTTLYYDATSQYFYNSHTGQFLYWDGEKRTYLPAPSSPTGGSAATTAPGSSNAQPGQAPVVTVEKKEKEKKEKVKIAKKIAKDMEKWAKQMNSQKEAEKELKKQVTAPAPAAVTATVVDVRREPATADAGFAVLEKTKGVSMIEDTILPPPMPYTASSPPHSRENLVASYGGGESDEEVEEEKLIDVEKMTCLLCKRRFNSLEILQKHCQMSDLHKANLEELRKKNEDGNTSPSSQQQYRDRAKERRQKYGAPPPPVPRGKAAAARPEETIFEQPTQHGIGNENIGNKLLQKMGWSEGRGLGRSQSGIVDPITATRRQKGVGLGAGSVAANIDANDTYKTAAKKTLFARFNDLH